MRLPRLAFTHTAAVCIALAVMLVAVGTQAAETDPAATIKTYHARLVKAVTDPANTTDKARYDALAPAMDAAFDFAGMIRTAAGRYYRSADAKTQAALRAAFRRVSIATYADQFADLGNGRFEIAAPRDGPRGLKLVESHLKTGSETVTLTYVMRKLGDGWRIIDVLLDGGVSELALRASEYARILKTGGAAALVASLDKQADTLLAK